MALDSTAVVRALRASLGRHATPERALQEKRYLKSELDFLGVALPHIRREAKALVRTHGPLAHDELLALTGALWKTRVHELRASAVALLELQHLQLSAADFPRLLTLIREAETWALVDWLATKVFGPIVAREPRAKKQLDRWARDPDFWVRRTALLSLHDELLAGAGDFEHFARLATPMLHEREFFIRKAIGWVLRSTAKRTPERTYAYVVQHAQAMSGLTFREATRNLTPPQIKRLTGVRMRGLPGQSHSH